MNQDGVAVDFSEGKWDPAVWLPFKSLRFDYVGGFVQESDHIANRCPEGVDDEELYAKHVTEVYASIVHPMRATGGGTVSATVSFVMLQAPPTHLCSSQGLSAKTPATLTSFSAE